MPVIQFSKTQKMCQIEDFPDASERSHLGSMHIRPGATRVVTAGELKHLRKIGIQLSVIQAVAVVTPKKPSATAPEPAVAPKAPSADVPVVEPPVSYGGSTGASESGSTRSDKKSRSGKNKNR